MQKEVAKRLRIDDASYMHWERGTRTPSITMLPRLIQFLGYDPFPESMTAGDEIVAKRRRHGISRKSLAKEIGIDESTLEKIEKSRMVLKPYVIRLMARLLAASWSLQSREQSQTIRSWPG